MVVSRVERGGTRDALTRRGMKRADGKWHVLLLVSDAPRGKPLAPIYGYVNLERSVEGQATVHTVAADQARLSCPRYG